MSDIQGPTNAVDDIPNRVRDVAVGFFGWIMFHNLLFISLTILVYLFLFVSKFVIDNGEDFYLVYAIVMWLSAIISPLVMFTKKRNWVASGILTAIFVNIGLWLMIIPQIAFAGVPFPLGMIVFPQ